MRMLIPFMWPRKSLPLQLVVFVCVLLLVAGRIVNLYTPIMYKYIGELMPNICYILYIQYASLILHQNPMCFNGVLMHNK